VRRVSIHKRTWAVGLQWYLSNARLGVPELRRLVRAQPRVEQAAEAS